MIEMNLPTKCGHRKSTENFTTVFQFERIYATYVQIDFSFTVKPIPIFYREIT